MTGLSKGAEFRFSEATQGFSGDEVEAGLLAFGFVFAFCCMPESNSCFKSGQNGRSFRGL